MIADWIHKEWGVREMGEDLAAALSRTSYRLTGNFESGWIACGIEWCCGESHL